MRFIKFRGGSMFNHKYIYVSVIAFTLLMACRLFAQPTEDSLIKAWEKQQKDDKRTVVFEKLKERHYKYKTNYFPYDGELIIKNTILSDLGGESENIYSLGAVQVELSGADTNLAQKYGQSYYLWNNTNNLYYDIKNLKWISNKEYFANNSKMLSARQKQFWWFSNISNFALILVLACGLLVIYKKNKSYTNTALRRQEEAISKYDIAVHQSEKALLLTEETNNLLKEILAVLKSNN